MVISSIFSTKLHNQVQTTELLQYRGKVNIDYTVQWTYVANAYRQKNYQYIPFDWQYFPALEHQKIALNYLPGKPQTVQT